jgi:NAD(P)-dependent dehydrogenase (short-subunit alcohol dehydrogenase family)
MVNLIGYTHPVAPLSETPAALFDDTVAANLRGVFRTTTTLLPGMADGASIVLVASGLAQFVRPGFGPYAAAKAGVIALAKTFAIETAPRLRVNVVAPGPVRTAFLTGGTGRGGSGNALVDVDRMAEAIPMGRIAEPSDVTGPIRFLLGPDSAFMTGQVLWINGGAYMP